MNGEMSVFTEFQGLEVMFHVATLMPFSSSDPQQVVHVHMCGYQFAYLRWLVAQMQKSDVSLLLVDQLSTCLAWDH